MCCHSANLRSGQAGGRCDLIGLSAGTRKGLDQSRAVAWQRERVMRASESDSETGHETTAVPRMAYLAERFSAALPIPILHMCGCAVHVFR